MIEGEAAAVNVFITATCYEPTGLQGQEKGHLLNRPQQGLIAED